MGAKTGRERTRHALKNPMAFRVALDIFRGPLDLLLYLVRKHEVEITEIPIALITDQYLEHLQVLEHLDVNSVGDFLEMASTLMEIKSRMILPHGDEEHEPIDDPRQELVRRLLEYKQYRDVANILDERSRAWQERYPRLTSDLPPRQIDPAAQEIREVELWDLVSAFGRIMRDNQVQQPASIVYDDTPIHVYMRQIYARLTDQGRLPLSSLFQPGMHKSKLVSIILAVLELVRHYRVIAEQSDLFTEIWLLPSETADKSLDFAHVDNYEHVRRDDAPPGDSTATR